MRSSANDFHQMHLNACGVTFDTVHKVLGKYYEEATGDADRFYEWGVACGVVAPNPGGAETRVEYQLTDEAQKHDYVWEVVAVILKELLDRMGELFGALETLKGDWLVAGIAGDVQDRIGYWAKEVAYFNARRLV